MAALAMSPLAATAPLRKVTDTSEGDPDGDADLAGGACHRKSTLELMLFSDTNGQGEATIFVFDEELATSSSNVFNEDKDEGEVNAPGGEAVVSELSELFFM